MQKLTQISCGLARYELHAQHALTFHSLLQPTGSREHDSSHQK